ncbi:hypothetical protein HHI36_016502 [Cryptolaemus montrouzieri]|uniref:Endonuclease/exonuclease/phosphatase domain-containing protein n=1 Tax=Cryptolaemus montrouzieri TaxID=559131 RepID=A0ABD2NJY3_9CUCU
MILTRDGIECEDVSAVKDMSVEMNVEMVAVKIPERKIVILGVYQKPSRDFKCFMDKLTYTLQELSAFEKFNIILTGDFNIDFIDESDQRN